MIRSHFLSGTLRAQERKGLPVDSQPDCRKPPRSGAPLEMEGLPGKKGLPGPEPCSRLCCVQLMVPFALPGSQRAGPASFPVIGRNNKSGPCSLPPTTRLSPWLHMTVHLSRMRAALPGWPRQPGVREKEETAPCSFKPFFLPHLEPLGFLSKGLGLNKTSPGA